VRYPFAPIDAHRGDTPLSVMAERIGVPHPTVEAWRRRGLEAHNADACATALGLHAYMLWPEMLAVDVLEVTRECEHPDCYEHFILTRSDKRFCSAGCRSRAPETMAKQRERSRVYARERYASDPEYREAKRRAVRERSESVKRAAAARQRDYYRRTAEKQRADRRARYQREQAA